MRISINVNISNTMIELVRHALVLSLEIITGLKMNKENPLYIDANIIGIQAYQAIVEIQKNNSLLIHVRDRVQKIIDINM